MIVVLDNIRSALNVGSIVRTCDAFGIKKVYLCGLTPDKADEKVKKTALGAEKGIEFTRFRTTMDAISELKDSGYNILGLEINDSAKDISKINTKGNNIALIVGNEVSGISDEVLKDCDEIVKIPMRGIKESLNVSVAFGIAAYIITNSIEI